MPVNMGSVDRAVRLTAGVALVGLAAVGTIGPWGFLGAIFIATGLVSRCPLYVPFGLSTCAKE